jgi:lysyl-tRNA synthetase class 2
MSPDTPLRERLRLRSQTLANIRHFFRVRDVLEVETAALSTSASTDPALASVTADVKSLGGIQYLHTSPEHAMKRLLASGSGDIFQIARVYRDGEIGRWHQPEFLLLEWYRSGFDEFELMDEVFDLLQLLLNRRIPLLRRQNLSYREAFQTCFAIDPLELDNNGERELARQLVDRGIEVPKAISSNALLDLALSTAVVTQWTADTAVFLYDYPANQAALAAIKAEDPPVAARFEVFINGLELANGFRELTDAAEQRRRFEADLKLRHETGLPAVPIDFDLLNALETGLPDCAGVALGIDRLVALLTGADSLTDVIPLAH